MTELPDLPSKEDIAAQRDGVRKNAFPARLGDMSLNGTSSRHALEPSNPLHRDKSRLRTDLTDLIEPDNLNESDRAAQDRERMSLMFTRAFLRQRLSFKDLEPYRVRVAYRWMREVCHLKSLVSGDQLLSDALLSRDDNPLTNPAVGTPATGDSYFAMRADVVEMVNELEGSPGVPLLPPPVPDQFRDEGGEVLESYNPEHDEPLVRWLQAFDRVSTYMGIPRGAPENEDEGRWGLYGMQDPDIVRLCFPHPMQVLVWEEMLVKETWDYIVAGGQRQAERSLNDTYGLDDVESQRLIKLARARSVLIHDTDLEIDRATLCARLEDIILRCRQGVPDIRAELQAIKALASIKGVTRGDIDDFGKEITTVISEVSREAMAKAQEKRQLTD